MNNVKSSGKPVETLKSIVYEHKTHMEKRQQMLHKHRKVHKS